jgi:hypothetical protein
VSEWRKVGSQTGVAVPSGWELVEDRPRLLVAVELGQDHVTIDRDHAMNRSDVTADPATLQAARE